MFAADKMKTSYQVILKNNQPTVKFLLRFFNNIRSYIALPATLHLFCIRK